MPILQFIPLPVRSAALLFVGALLLNACSPAIDAPATAAIKPLPPTPSAEAVTEGPAAAIAQRYLDRHKGNILWVAAN